MIKTKQDLIEYLEADKKALGRAESHPHFYDVIWKYEVALRHCEYYKNMNKTVVTWFLYMFWRYRYYKLGERACFTIPLNCFGKGLSIAHIGPIIVNGGARVGKNCRLHVGVNIGTAAGTSGCAPIIGDNVYIGPGAKVFGPIRIADDIAIGANAVVNKSCLENSVTLAGVPAKIVSDKGSKGLLVSD